MRNDELFRKALMAAWEVGERIRTENNRAEWTDEEIDAGAQEFKRRMLGEKERE